MPAPATSPWLMPMFQPSGCETSFITVIASVVAFSNSKSSASSRSVMRLTWRYGQIIRCPTLYGYRFMMANTCVPRQAIRPSSSDLFGPAQNGHSSVLGLVTLPSSLRST